MPRFLHRHKSTEFSSSPHVPFFREQLSKLPRSRSLRLSKRRRKDKDGQERRGLRRLKDYLESPRTGSFSRSKFHEAFDEDQYARHSGHAHEATGEYSEDDDEDDASEHSDRGLLRLPRFIPGVASRGSRESNAILTEQDTQIKAREESPHLLRPPPRQAGSLNKIHVPSREPSGESVPGEFGNATSPRRGPLAGRNVVIPSRSSSSAERRRTSIERGLDSRFSNLPIPVLSSSDNNSVPTPLLNRILASEPNDFTLQTRRNSIHQESSRWSTPFDERISEAAETRSGATEEDVQDFVPGTLSQPDEELQHSGKKIIEKNQEREASLSSESSSDLPSLPRRLMRIPAGKVWRNAHKNYFPPGASEMPQDLVVRICNRYRGDYEGRCQDKKQRYL
jgi:hypothetical protein